MQHGSPLPGEREWHLTKGCPALLITSSGSLCRDGTGAQLGQLRGRSLQGRIRGASQHRDLARDPRMQTLELVQGRTVGPATRFWKTKGGSSAAAGWRSSEFLPGIAIASAVTALTSPSWKCTKCVGQFDATKLTLHFVAVWSIWCYKRH